MTRTAAIPFTLLALLLGVAPAAAQREARSEAGARILFRVSMPVADLDLDTHRGRAALEARIERLARTTCGGDANASAYDQSNVAECRSNFEAAARNALRNRRSGRR